MSTTWWRHTSIGLSICACSDFCWKGLVGITLSHRHFWSFSGRQHFGKAFPRGDVTFSMSEGGGRVTVNDNTDAELILDILVTGFVDLYAVPVADSSICHRGVEFCEVPALETSKQGKCDKKYRNYGPWWPWWPCLLDAMTLAGSAVMGRWEQHLAASRGTFEHFFYHKNSGLLWVCCGCY